jgi:glucosamine-phosphate N-acetyltransferase
MTIYYSLDLNNETFVLRDLCVDDYSKNYLDLLGQLSKIDKEQVKFQDFLDFINELNERNKVFIIENKDTDKIIACATVFIENKIIHNMGKVCHVEDVVVDNSMRGTGMGKILMGFVNEYANKMGCYKTILDCAQHNVVFYEKCGFKNNGFQMSLYHSSL